MVDETRRADDAADLPGAGELTDDELEFVVGGLTRPWVVPLLPWEQPSSSTA